MKLPAIDVEIARYRVQIYEYDQNKLKFPQFKTTLVM